MQLVYAYNHNVDHEVRDQAAGLVPSHRLFGLIEAKAAGHAARHVRLSWLARRLPPRLWRAYQAAACAVGQRRIDAVIATHEAAALPLLALRRLGLLRAKVVVINVSLLRPRNLTGRRHRLLCKLLPAADHVVCYGSGQVPAVCQAFGIDRAACHFVPLGVDAEFGGTRFGRPGKPNLLAVGTNEGKDYPTLVAALPDGVPLRIVADAENVAQARAAAPPGADIAYEQAVPIRDLQRLYAAATAVAIPLREGSISSGQTVLLECMALGRPVVVSDVAAVRDYVQDGRTALLVPPGDVEALRRALRRVLDDAELAARLGEAAAGEVRAWFTAAHSATAILCLLGGEK